jgi:3-deoxy-D-manno-octulosonic-acid transferase
MWGIRPIIGPSWENFHWVGREIVKQGLVKVARDWRAVSDLLIQDLHGPPSREAIKKAIFEYMKRRQGGTAYACRVIQTVLEAS